MGQAGSRLKDVAEHLDLSISTTVSRMKSLGLQLADRVGLPLGAPGRLLPLWLGVQRLVRVWGRFDDSWHNLLR
jgi:hypothetical protein